jgi:hopanoid-associated phosphorylase
MRALARKNFDDLTLGAIQHSLRVATRARLAPRRPDRERDVGDLASLSPRRGRGLLVVSGLAAESRIAAGPRIQTFSFGGASALLEEKLAAALRDGAAGVLSFGVAGGLAPGVAPGAVVLGETIICGGERIACDPGWLRSLTERLPGATRAPIFGADAAVARAPDKARLAANTGAAAVDMESHIAARWAARHGARFAAIRVIADPLAHSLPPAALVGMRADGTTDIYAVLRSLGATPRQLPALLQTALGAKRAFDGLKSCRRALGDDFGLFG